MLQTVENKLNEMGAQLLDHSSTKQTAHYKIKYKGEQYNVYIDLQTKDVQCFKIK